MIITASSSAQLVHTEVVDLKPQWKGILNNRFVPYDETGGTIYIPIEKTDGQLSISGSMPISIYINHKLILQSERHSVLKLDSLSNLYGVPMLFALRSSGEVATRLYRSIPEDQLVPRQDKPMKDFVTIASIILIMLFIALLYVNPKLTFDYFNIVKFLTLQEREETLTAIRTTSSINFVYYLFCSLWIAFLLITMGQVELFQIQFFWATAINFGQFALNWLLLGLIIFFVLMSKLVAISLLAGLFNIGEVASFQFFNSIRIFFIASALAAFLGLLLFMFKVSEPQYYFLVLKMGFGLVALSIALLLFKLMDKVPFRFSHLFSYLCVSEIIPLMILIKVLFK